MKFKFKRANKITSLLLAAAAVVSLVPATAANAAERLGTKDGTIENAIAFKDGKYIYSGYKSDDDDKSVYFNDGSKDKELDDVEDADIDSVYSDKYAFLKDGSDQYLVDLSNGSVSDDETPEDTADNVITKLKSTLKKTDRYEDSSIDVAVSKIGNSKFTENWYQYAATSTGDGKSDGDTLDGYTFNYTDTNGTAQTLTGDLLFGYTNESGKYIDASKIANVYAYSYEKKKVVKISEFNDTDKDSELTATLTAQPTVLTQDSDYIYALAKVKITTAGGASEAKTYNYLQKISKAQGDKKDDAYLPKSVDSYLIDNKSVYDNGDANDAYKALFTSGDYDVTKNQYRVKDGALYVTSFSAKEDNIKVFKLTLTKIKEDSVDSSIKSAAGKLDGYVVKKSGSKDSDVTDLNAVSIDVNGNTWFIDEGKINKFDGTTIKEMYTCDRSLDRLDAYDDTNLIAWEDGEDVYTTVGEGKSVTETEAPAQTPATPAQTGWVNTSTGWTFYDAAGKQVKNSWITSGGTWYFIKADGTMATGWYSDNGTWYLLNASGAMQTGWKSVNGTWYYLQSSGALKTGWLNESGSWYYLDASGAMLANTTVGGYTLGANGAWVK